MSCRETNSVGRIESIPEVHHTHHKQLSWWFDETVTTRLAWWQSRPSTFPHLVAIKISQHKYHLIITLTNVQNLFAAATMQDATMNDGVLGSSSEIENEIVMRVRAKFLEMGHYFFWGSAKIRAKSILNTTKSIAEKENYFKFSKFLVE